MTANIKFFEFTSTALAVAYFTKLNIVEYKLQKKSQLCYFGIAIVIA